jgi:hypothetical protein
MFHREKFGTFGRYVENTEMIEHLRKMHDVYLQEVCILQLFTQDDIAKMDYSDVYVLGQELINKSICGACYLHRRDNVNLPPDSARGGLLTPLAELKGGEYVQSNRNTQEKR